VRRVGQCRGLLTKHERLLRLERATAERKVELPEEQTTRFSREFRERHLEAPHTGSLLAVGTFFVGTLKGVGKFYLQTAIDCCSLRLGAALHQQAAGHRRAPDERCHSGIRGDGARIKTALSGDGRALFGRPDQHMADMVKRL